MMYTKKEIGAVLRKMRERAGFTQKQVAEHFGRKQQVIGHWETGYAQPDVSTLFELCDLYNSDVSVEFGFKTKKSPGADESAPGDKKINDIMELVSGLDDSQKVFLLALLEKVHERNQQTHPTAQVSISSAVPESVNQGQT